MSRRMFTAFGSALLVALLLSWRRQWFLNSEDHPPVVGVDQYALVDSYKVHYVQAGSGEPIVLIPGSFFTYREWDRLLPLLANDYRLIAVDYIGVGQSDKPTSGFDYSVQAQAEIVLGLLDALGIDKANVMGVSYGGSIALYMGARWPDRISKVVSIEGFTNVDNVTLPWVDWLAGLLRIPLIGDLFIFLIQTGLLEGVRAAIMARQERVALLPSERQVIVETIRSSSKSATRHGWHGIASARTTSSIRSRGESHLMGQISVPVLQLVGTASVFREAIQPTLQELSQVPTVRIVTVEEGAHDMQLQHPEVVARLVHEFLSPHTITHSALDNGSHRL